MRTGLMVFPFTVPERRAGEGPGSARDALQGVYARSLARVLAERLEDGAQVPSTVATLTARGGDDGQAAREGWLVASEPWDLDEACAVGLPAGTSHLLQGAAELTDRVRLRVLLVDQPAHRLALDHVVLRPRGELFAALEEASSEVEIGRASCRERV